MDERELLDIVIINHYSTNSCIIQQIHALLPVPCSLFPLSQIKLKKKDENYQKNQ